MDGPTDDPQDNPLVDVIGQGAEVRNTEKVHLSLFVENTTTYMAGWVVRSALPKVQCGICREALVALPGSTPMGGSYHLLQLKDNGGLVTASPGAVRVVRETEIIIRSHMTDLHTITNMVPQAQVTREVLGNLGFGDVFLLGRHINETSYALDNHGTNLIRLLVVVFYNMRKYELARLHNYRHHHGWSSRANLTKAVLFKGQ